MNQPTNDDLTLLMELHNVGGAINSVSGMQMEPWKRLVDPLGFAVLSQDKGFPWGTLSITPLGTTVAWAMLAAGRAAASDAAPPCVPARNDPQ